MLVDHNIQYIIDKLLLVGDQFMDKGFFTEKDLMMAHVDVVSLRCDAYILL